MEFERLNHAVRQISMSEEAKQRILQTDWEQKRRCQYRGRMIHTMAALCAVLLLSLGGVTWIHGQNAQKWGVLVYAKEDGKEGWVRLKKGQRMLLQKQGDYPWYEIELELPEKFYFDKEMMILGFETIHVGGGNTLRWYEDMGNNKERYEYEMPEAMTQELNITILGEDNKKEGMITLEATIDHGKRYLELK